MGELATLADVALIDPDAAGSRTVLVPLAKLRLGPSPRLGVVKSGHIEILAEISSKWPPLLIRRDFTIVDGRYRYLAARQLQLLHVECEYFNGDESAAFVEAIRRNVEHGLPLTLRERKSAASQLIRSDSDWSDRRIAGVCGLSHTTVARLRDVERTSGRVSSLGDTRLGKDGRLRPVNATSVRERIREEIAGTPDASLREIARRAGSTPETVRAIRNSPQALPRPGVSSADPASGCRGRPVAGAVTEDPAFRSTQEGRDFGAWFAETSIDDDSWCHHVDAVPLSRMYEVADEARRRAVAWSAFAEALEGRSRGRRASG